MIVDAHCHLWPEQMPEGSLRKVMDNTEKDAAGKHAAAALKLT